MSSCNNINSSDELINHIPDQTQILIRLYKSEATDLNDHLKRFLDFDELENVQEQLKVLKGYNPENEGLLSFVQLERDKLDFILVKEYKDALAIRSDSIASFDYDGEKIHSRSFENATLYS